MSKKLLIMLLIIAIIILAIAGISAMQRGKQNGDSGAEESSALVTEIIVVPAEMPSRISFKIPPGFTETSSQYYDKYYILNDASVITTGEKLVIGGTMLEDYVADVKKQYEETADEYTLLSDNEITVSGGVPCRVLEFTYAIVGEDVRQEMKCVSAVLIQDDFVYIVTCKSKRENFETYRAAFLQTIESITIEEEASPAETTADAG